MWKIYAWLLAILLIASYGLILTGNPTIVDIIDIPISIMSLIGLFAFAYSKFIISEKFWRIWLVALLSWDVIYNIIFTFVLGIGQDIQGLESPSLLDITVGFLFLLPEYCALYFYGFKRHEAWK